MNKSIPKEYPFSPAFYYGPLTLNAQFLSICPWSYPTWMIFLLKAVIWTNSTIRSLSFHSQKQSALWAVDVKCQVALCWLGHFFSEVFWYFPEFNPYAHFSLLCCVFLWIVDFPWVLWGDKCRVCGQVNCFLGMTAFYITSKLISSLFVSAFRS